MNFATLFVSVLFFIKAIQAGEENEDQLKQVTQSLNKFSFDLFKKITDGRNENLVCSPLSVHMLLSLAASGAEGQTSEEMKKALYLSEDDSSVRIGFKDMSKNLKNLKNVTLEITNNLYLSNKMALNPDFKDTATSDFSSNIDVMDFSKPEKTVQYINEWVKKFTHQKIKEIITEDMINESTQMVLLNAVYFLGDWLNPFETYFTEDGDFFLDKETKKTVKTMFTRHRFSYGEFPEQKAKMIKLPYINPNFEMTLIVPDEIDGLGEISKNIDYFDENTINEASEIHEVTLYLPKFKIESELKLREPLEQLGMTDMFLSTANFSKISDVPFQVQSVIQKAVIDVNEVGSEAAATTLIIAVESSGSIEPKQYIIKADRPFYYRITYNGAILFQGVVYDPNY